MGTGDGVRQRGFTLIEMVIVVAIVITVATVVFAMSAGARPMAMRSAVTQFDAVLAYAKALAATSGNGATLIFAPRDSARLTIAVYSGRPTAPGALRPAGIAPIAVDANVTEETLGSPPFALFVNGSGHASMARADAVQTPAPLAAEPACPATGEWVLVFSDARTPNGTNVRRLACSPGRP